MKKILISLCILLSQILFADPIEVKGKGDLDKLKADKENEVIFIDFWFEACGPCKKIKPKIKELSNDPKYKKSVKIVTADIEIEGNEELQKIYDVSGAPVILILKREKGEWKLVKNSDDKKIFPQDFRDKPEKIQEQLDEVVKSVKEEKNSLLPHAPRTH